MIGYRPSDQGVIFGSDRRFSFNTFRPVVGPALPLIQCVPGGNGQRMSVRAACNAAVNKRTECYVHACTSLDLEVLSSV